LREFIADAEERLKLLEKRKQGRVHAAQGRPLLGLAVVCEEAANNIEDRLTAG
jgi:hypothetical protein